MINFHIFGKTLFIRNSVRSIMILSLFTCMGCSSSIDQAASKPSAQIEAVVTQLNESGAEIVLDSAGEVIAVKLSENTTPEVIATLAELTKLKRIDATETKFKQPTFADLKSQRPELEIELPN